MKSLSGKEFAKILERQGWTLLRIQGSHHIMERPQAMCGCQYLFTAIGLLKAVC
jgi:predicted RNA binding protein YcfA (HicA-like mRNA interferase family)